MRSLAQHQAQTSAAVAFQFDVMAGCNRYGRNKELGGDRQSASAAVDQRRQPDARRAAVVEQLVHCRAYGASRIEHVVDQNQVAALDFKRDVGSLDAAMQSAFFVVVPVERYIERSKGDFGLEIAV